MQKNNKEQHLNNGSISKKEQLKNSLVLLRFPFSLFLLPTFFFAWSQVEAVNSFRLILVFILLHLLVYPASNGYNSYMDRDTGSIGGLEKPPMPNKLLFHLTIAMDMLAIVLAFFINIPFMLAMLVYISFSRAYSYRGIRLKKYPIIGFLTVFIVQGAVTFFMIYKGINADETQPPLICLFISSLLLGALYPLTQIYQHRQDAEDGVTSISYLLGYRGTFVFSGILFALANLLLFIYFSQVNRLGSFFIIAGALLPAVGFFLYWMYQVFADSRNANFKNSLRMNIVAAICTNTGFIVLTILRT